MTGLLVCASAASWSMPTAAPCRFTDRIAASMSSSRRAARWASQRVRRPSTVVSGTTSPFTIPTVSHTLGSMSTSRRAAIVGGNRIPFARSNGRYAHASNQDMLTAAIDGLVARFGLQDQRLGEVSAGAVLKHSRDFNLTRESVLGSRLSAQTPAYDVQQACGTGLETVILTANKIALGQIDSAIAAGVDTTSDAPIAVNEDLRAVLLEANRATSLGGRIKALAGIRPTQLVPAIPQNS